MSRIEPRAYLRFIVDEWPLIEAVYDRARRGPVRIQTLRTLAGASKLSNAIDRLIENGIIVQLPNSPAYEMGEFVQNLVAHLKQEQQLGLAGEIRIYLEDLDEQTRGVIAALDGPDHDKLQRHVQALNSRLKTIVRHLRNNATAVDDIVVRAKTRQRHIPLRARYAEVLLAWESYIDPVRDMVDPAGPFEALFERLERELGHAQEAVSTHGSLLRERKHLELVLLRLMELRTHLRQHLSEAAEKLLPLVREIRRNSGVARGASIALKSLRDGTLDALQLSNLLPFCRRQAPTAISGAEQIQAYLANLSEYSPVPQAMPLLAATTAATEPPFNAESVISRIPDALPIPDLLAWLLETAQEKAAVDDLLDLYFTIKADDEVYQSVATRPQWYDSPTHRVRAAAIQVNAIRT